MAAFRASVVTGLGGLWVVSPSACANKATRLASGPFAIIALASALGFFAGEPAGAQAPPPPERPVMLAQFTPPLPRPHPERDEGDPIGDFLGAAAALFGGGGDPPVDDGNGLGALTEPDFLLTSAYRRLRAGDFDSAVRIARAMANPAGALLIEWLIAIDGDPDIGSTRLAEAAASVADWPARTLMAIRFEQALQREEPTPEAVVAALEGASPVLDSTVLLLARSLSAVGREAEAVELIRPFWRDEEFSRDTEDAILEEYGEFLAFEDHHWRMSRLLYDTESEAGLRVSAQLSADMQRLGEAWAAVNRGSEDASRLMSEVPASIRSDPGYLYARLRLLIRSGAYGEASVLLLSAPNDPSVLVDPDAWSQQRRAMARALVDRGDATTAHEVLAGHSAIQRTEIVEIEFQAGWTALRLLDDPETAMTHFEALAASSSRPLSQSRAHYWLGRSHDALGRTEDAEDSYEIAAAYQTTIYGQLAIIRLGRSALPAAAAPEIDEAAREAFAADPMAQAVMWLYGLDRETEAELISRFLADTTADAADVTILAQLAEAGGDHQLALQIGKLAMNRELPVEAVAFSTALLPTDTQDIRVEPALVLAVARQESAFDVRAVSPAGALGLLQILPATAREMAGLLGFAYSEARLTTDPAYNAALGGAYLASLLERYDGNYALALAAFNAGPSRANRWIEAYGDPRRADVDTIDWIERVPFDETRNYILRVIENLQVYRAILDGAPINLIEDLDL